MNIAMQKALEHAVEVKAADVSKVNAYVMRATQIVCNEMVRADPELNQSTALTVAIQLTSSIIDELQEGLSPLGPISPAALGKALAGEFGERVTAQIARSAVNVTQIKQRERQKRQDELHRLDMLRAPVNNTEAGPSYGLDLGGYAAEQAKRFQMEDLRSATSRALPGDFIEPNEQALGEATLAQAYPARERGAAPNPHTVAKAVDRAHDVADRAALDLELSRHKGRDYPKPKRGKR